MTAVRTQTAIVEYHAGEWLVLHHDGAVEVKATAEDAVRVLRSAAKRGNESITVTRIEWRNVPEGFVPPEGGRS